MIPILHRRKSFNSSGPSTYYGLIISDGPLAYWRMNEASGTNLVDSSGNGYDIFLTDSTITYGVSGALTTEPDDAMDFSTSKGSLIGTPNAFIPSNFSFELWMNADSAAIYNTLMMKSDSGAWAAGWGFYYDGSNWTFFLGPYLTYNISAVGLSLNTWYHIVGTYDGTTMRLYVDGSEVDSDTATLTWGAGNLLLATSGLSGYFDGTLDEVAFYDYKLTAGQVAAHYAAR